MHIAILEKRTRCFFSVFSLAYLKISVIMRREGEKVAAALVRSRYRGESAPLGKNPRWQCARSTPKDGYLQPANEVVCVPPLLSFVLCMCLRAGSFASLRVRRLPIGDHQ